MHIIFVIKVCWLLTKGWKSTVWAQLHHAKYTWVMILFSMLIKKNIILKITFQCVKSPNKPYNTLPELPQNRLEKFPFLCVFIGFILLLSCFGQHSNQNISYEDCSSFVLVIYLQNQGVPLLRDSRIKHTFYDFSFGLTYVDFHKTLHER